MSTYIVKKNTEKLREEKPPNHFFNPKVSDENKNIREPFKENMDTSEAFVKHC